MMLFPPPELTSSNRPEEFKEKRVLVVGLGNTAADTAASLAGVASKIYLSHTSGTFVVSV